MLGCVSELQTSMGAVTELSPAWITAAAKHFAPRLDALCHIFLLQPQLASVFQQASKREPQEMVRLYMKYDYCIHLLIYEVVWKHRCRSVSIKDV